MDNLEKYSLKVCPNCGADVEGLIHHCDCCGELLYPKNNLFSYMVYEAGPFFDIQVYLNKIFDALAAISPDRYDSVIRRIEFDFWCYPIKKKTGATYYSSSRRVIVTIRVEEDSYLYGSKKQKLMLLADEMQRNMDALQIQLQKRRLDVDEDLFLQIRTILSQMQAAKID